MKFIKLEIHNLASLDKQGGETINFEEGALGGSTIFSIVGPTGSGKSTILDAICLALYNRTPRYPRMKGDKNQHINIFGDLEEGEKNRLAPTDARNIITRGKKEGYSKLTFLANNGVLYRAEWYVRRGTKNFQDVVTSLYKITNDNGQYKEEVDEWNTLPQIIGLDYEQFLRTVLIAQGSFSKFLTAKEDERYALLEKLVGCEELYTSVATRIKAERDKATMTFASMEASLATFKNDDLEPQELEVLQERIKMLEEEENKAKNELVKITEAIAWYTTNDKHIKQLASYTESQTRVKQDIDDVKEDLYRLNLHERTLPAVKIYNDMIAAQNNIKKKQEELAIVKNKIAATSKEIKEADNTLCTLKQNEKNASELLEEQRPRINQARIIKAGIFTIEDDLEKKSQELNRCKIAHNLAIKNVESNKKAIEDATAELNKAKEALEDLKTKIQQEKQQLTKMLNAARNEYNEEYNILITQDAILLQEAKSIAEQKLHDFQNAIEIIKSIAEHRSTIRLNNQTIESKQKRNKELSAELETLTIEALTAEIKMLRRTHTLITSENWAEHRHNLTGGNPCPLCGATEHPYKNEEAILPVIDELQQSITAKEYLLKQQTNRQTNILTEQAQISERIKMLVNDNNNRDEVLKDLSNQWNDIQVRYPDWMADADFLHKLKPAIENEVKTTSDNLSAYNALVSKVERLREEKETAERELNDYTNNSNTKIDQDENRINDKDSTLRQEMAKTPYLVQQQTEKANDLKTANKDDTTLRDSLNKKTKELHSLIGDKDPDAYEKELSSAKDNASQDVTQKSNEVNTLRETLQGLNGQQKVLCMIIDDDKKTSTSKNQQLTEWIDDYNTHNTESISSDTIVMLYNAPDDWETIRKRKQTLGDALSQASALLSNETTAYETHQQTKPETSLSDLKTREEELKQRSTQQLIDDKTRLQRYEKAKQQMGVLGEQKRQAELLQNNWEEIYKAIGSDGKTLRKIAQCYTLRFLIEHANVEIRKFNSRYELQQVKNSLGIRVIDHDRADDVRDTTSLSGGETFIVSLGLALGLSALSSRNISFDNLFIDEGFGTLDPDTLATVIDSLAMLQSSQGKKVGVISHTDTMSERITTQIRIIKNGNSGSSHIEIYP